MISWVHLLDFFVDTTVLLHLHHAGRNILALHPPHRTQHDVVIRGRMEQLIAHSPVPAGQHSEFQIPFPKGAAYIDNQMQVA